MTKHLMIILLIIISFPLNIFANNFPNISTFGFDYGNLTNNLNLVKWLAQRHDWWVGGVQNETVYDAAKSVNPNIRFMSYIAYNTYELSVQNWIKSWCEQNGYNFENTFYHYYYDTTVKLRGSNPSQILVKGYGGGTAKTIQESRVPSSWAQYSNGGISSTTGEVIRLNINPTSIVWRRGYEAFTLENRIKINAAKGKYAEGIILDTFDGTVYDAKDLQLERTIEMRNFGKYTREEANAQANNDLIAAMKELKTYLTIQTGKSIIVVPNAGDISSLYYWRKFLYADRIVDYDNVAIEYMVRAGSSKSVLPYLKQAYDTMVDNGIVFFARNETSISNVSESVKQFLIASHYLINHPNYILFFHRGSASYYGGDYYTTHWHKNLEYDIGAPVKRSGQDYWGAADTDRFFIFASVTTNSDSLKNYTIVGREYTNALVLAKFGAKGGVANAGNNPTKHNLNGTYRLLQPDNSLGPPITEITLGDSEGAILIKEQQALIPSPPPTITPTPTPTPIPTPTPASTTTSTPTPTPIPTPTPASTHTPTPAPTPMPASTHTPTPAPTPMPASTHTPTPAPTPMPASNHTPTPPSGATCNATLKMYLAVSQINTSGSPIGNIKSYELTNSTNVVKTNDTNVITTNDTNIATGVQVVDSTKSPALDSNNLIKDSSKSHWSSGADGNKVDKGGVGEVLLKRDKARNIFTNLRDPNLMSESNEFAIENEKLTPEMLGLATGDTSEREKLIQYVQGYDAYSKDKEKTSLKKRKWILGSIVNSRPLVIPYGNSKKVIFVGANDGMLHAFDDSTGEELWGFIPSELLGRLKELPQGNGLKYFVDGSPKAYLTNSQKIIVFGLRRGGNNYYALDVTNPESPKFLWKIGPETTGFSEIGQTWSDPQFGKIKYGTGAKAVCIIGGGYDENQDRKTPAAEDKKGRAVYMVDPLTGQQVWRWDSKKDPNMKHSIPSTISCVDVNGDGYIDRLYVGDMGGKLWRLDLKGSDPNGWSGKVVFNSNVGYTGSGKQKIFSKPDVTLEKGGEMVLFGTGDREHPYEKIGNDKFYAFMDKGSGSALSEDNLADVTKDFATVQNLANKEGWFINLEDKGEKVLAPPVVAFGVVYFTTFTPSLDGDGIARIYALNYRVGNPIFNLNPENDQGGPKIDLSDRSKIIGTGIPSGTVISALRGRPFAYTGFAGGLYSTHLKGYSTIIPISWKEVSKKK